MATRTPLRDRERSRVDSHGLLHRAEDWVEDWADETGGLAPDTEPAEGMPLHAVLLIVFGLALLGAVEITLVFGVAKLVTGHAY